MASIRKNKVPATKCSFLWNALEDMLKSGKTPVLENAIELAKAHSWTARDEFIKWKAYRQQFPLERRVASLKVDKERRVHH